MQNCNTMHKEIKENQLYDNAVDNYGRAVENNDGLALLRYNRATVSLAKLTGERLAEVQADVISCYNALVAMR